jgi:hypothetical protein
MPLNNSQVFSAAQHNTEDFFIYEQLSVKKHFVFLICRSNFESDKEFLNFVNFTLESLNKNI